MDNIKNIKVKETKVLIYYHLSSERLKGIQNKVELVKAVTELFRKDWEDIV